LQWQGHTGPNVMKLFTAVIYKYATNTAKYFAAGKPFKSSLMFVS